MSKYRSNFVVGLSVAFLILFVLFWAILNFGCDEFGCLPPGIIHAIFSLPWNFVIDAESLAPDLSSLRFYFLSFVPGVINFCLLFFGIPLFKKWLDNPKGKV